MDHRRDEYISIIQVVFIYLFIFIIDGFNLLMGSFGGEVRKCGSSGEMGLNGSS